MSKRVVILTGGVGGAKLVLGLMQIMPAERITAIVNTGDDFEHLGLAISPDLDTLLYTLSGKANAAQGWGRDGESWQFMDALKSLGGEDWFLLGDGDMALHVLRTRLLATGNPLSAVTARFAKAWGVDIAMLPMTDDPVATHLTTDEGDLPFQHYFVARRCAPKVQAIRFEGADHASPAPGVLEAIAEADAILIAPSNPWLSVDPLLAVPGIRTALETAKAPIVAVSPIVGGQAVKGPTAKLMSELGLGITNTSIAAHYNGVIDGLLVDMRDGDEDLSLSHMVTDTLMQTLDDRARVAQAALDLAARLAS
ncbi:2-phospho-L-lactate transferase [Sphingobium sp. AP49]|uniref:2-phospho-L-lactate transferase n=1 Tax=Sphingobium sp. AP49 TaxID=1144307 RepID=UPI00026EDCD5|nr:2-phospho-L-lactate transferase [Sphingobium sp. AP49]WHO39119.1 2-phospho-L-lactate transferase [Sphingobium sp. AP49]